MVRDILADIDDISFSLLTSGDVVRHRLVGNIVDAYERWDSDRATDRDTDGRAPERGRPPGRSGRPTHRSSAAHRKAPEVDR